MQKGTEYRSFLHLGQSVVRAQ